MPVGTAAPTLQNIPAQPFVVNPGAFNDMTTKNVKRVKQWSHDPGVTNPQTLLQTGIVSLLKITFEGELGVAENATPTTNNQWPYNLLSHFTLAANGQNNLWDCQGMTLENLRNIMYPAFTDSVDTFPGTVGGGNNFTDANDGDQIYLTWLVPIATDQTNLFGSLFAQSGATNLTVYPQMNTVAGLFTDAVGASLTGTWSLEETWFEIPFVANDQGQLVLAIPDLSRLHGVQEIYPTFTGTGFQRFPLIRLAGQLMRLGVQCQLAANTRASASPSIAAARRIEALQLEYGGNQVPRIYDPAASLLEENNRYYGNPPSYDFIWLDFVRESPMRDVVLQQNVTELAVDLTINDTATVTAGRTTLVQEYLF